MLKNVSLFALIGFMALAFTQHESDNIAQSAQQICPKLVGSKAPEVSLTRVDGKPFELFKELAHGPVVLIFYRGGW